MRFRRFYNNLRCTVGLHRLKAWKAPIADEPDACPMDPRSRPGPGDQRKCDWCGARWRGAYDGIEPFWNRVS